MIWRIPGLAKIVFVENNRCLLDPHLFFSFFGKQKTAAPGSGAIFPRIRGVCFKFYVEFCGKQNSWIGLSLSRRSVQIRC